MKNKLLFTVFTFIFMLIRIPSVFAIDNYEINQTVFDNAKAGTPSNSVSYASNWYTLAPGNYTLTGNIDLAANDGIEIVHGNNVGTNLNIGTYNISGNNSMIIYINNSKATISGTGFYVRKQKNN